MALKICTCFAHDNNNRTLLQQILHLPLPSPSKPSSYLPALVAYPLSRECKNTQNIRWCSNYFQWFLMRAITFYLDIVIIHREMPKVGVVNRLHMCIVHNLIKFPPPLIALYPPLLHVHVPSCSLSHTTNLLLYYPCLSNKGKYSGLWFCIVPPFGQANTATLRLNISPYRPPSGAIISMYIIL